MKKKTVFYSIIILLLLAITIMLWNGFCSVTRIGFINYQVVSLGQIAKANDNSFIDIEEIAIDKIDDVDNYDMVFMNGMGLRITEEQRKVIEDAVNSGLAILTTSATNPANNITSLDSVSSDTLVKYLNGGGRRNYRSMLNYVRNSIDKKYFFTKESYPLIPRSNDLIFHANIENPDEEEVGFNSVADYVNFLRENGLYDKNAPQVIVTGQMGEPANLVHALEESGNVVFPIRNLSSFIKDGHIDSIAPSAVINMAHGRIGDYFVDYLAKQNIPLFSPLNTNKLVADWESDKMGMSGGFLSQSIVTPEIDGALRPFALFGHFINEEGLHETYAIPERLETFVETINNYISLQRKNNSEKRVAIYYYKGPGQNVMTAGGMEVSSSLFNLLKRMKKEGYRVDNLPESHSELTKMIQEQGSVFGTYAQGAYTNFIKNGNPELINKKQYEEWVTKSLRPELYDDVIATNGEFPGDFMTTDDGRLAIARVQLGNVVLIPQVAAGRGSNSFQVVHGTDMAPPHAYIASYLWARHSFGADAMIHFGTHGSLEFTPRKQVALCSNDWPDRLVGSMPHFYIYSINNVGEGVIAKRRSYAGLQSYLTPPFMESNVRGMYRELSDAIKKYNNLLAEGKEKELEKASLAVKNMVLKLGLHRDLELDSIVEQPYTETEISKIENFAEELASEKITGQLYTMGVPYEEARINSSVYAMAVDPIAYSLLAIDKQRNKVQEGFEKQRVQFSARYLEPARNIVTRLLSNPALATDDFICKVSGITLAELNRAREIEKERNAPKGMMAMMRSKGVKKEFSKEEKNSAMAIVEVERCIKNVNNYRKALLESPEDELASMMNALNGGYTKPSPGGDPITNPNTLPTGRNLYSINAEATPGEVAWEKGKRLAENTIEMYRKRHNDSLPRKVSYTLWSGEFIETEGATIAQVLYMLGVEPIRDAFGRVTDLRLIPSAELGRSRIDVVVQTSGQLRDIAASRLHLINRAVEMAANATDDVYENMVNKGVVESERTLVQKGLSPKEAREISTFRVFGGVNGGYGTGIQGMVQAGDRWENEQEISNVYLNNMGAFYGDEKNWEKVYQYAFEAALTRTDAVIQPRQSNTWGALSLDHVYEFMGGMNLAVRNVTGKDPDAYFSDYRNRNNMRMQEVKEAMGVESRTTIFNPSYIKEKMKGDASSAASFAEIIQNTYGWNVMKPKAVDDAMWNEIYNVYVKDKFDLGVQNFFENKNPAALQEITSVMVETARKGMWNASDEQLSTLVKMHTDLIKKYRPSCSGFVCDNMKLQQFIASKSDKETADVYRKNITSIREKVVSGDDTKSMVMKKEEVSVENDTLTTVISNSAVLIVSVAVIMLLILVLRRRRKNMQE